MQLRSIFVPLTLAVAASANPIEKRAESTYSVSLYSKPDFQGEQSTFTGDGTHKVTFTGGAQSWIYESEPNDGCCIAFCRGSTNVGRYCGSAFNPTSSAGTTKVVTGCGDAVLNC